MKFKLKKLSFLIALYAYQSINVIAAEDINAPVVPVSDKKVKTSLTQPNIEQATQEINKTAGGVNIIDAEKLREGRMSNFNDTLGMATGVLAQSRFGAEETRLSIRGSGIQRTFHGRGIKLMQDGIPTNLADGGFDLTLFTTDDLSEGVTNKYFPGFSSLLGLEPQYLPYSNQVD